MSTALKCSNCGANLSAEDGATRVRCGYCGATNTLHAPGETSPEQVPEAPHSRVVFTPPTSPPSVIGCTLPLLAGALLVAGGAAAVWWSAAGKGQLPWEHMQWTGNASPILMDLDGDGANEVVGIVRFLEDDFDTVVGTVAAFDPVSGHRRWAHRVEDAEANELVLAAAYGRLWLADGRGRLTTLDPTTGAVLSETKTGEKPDQFCGDGDGLVLRLADRTAHAISPTGTVGPGTPTDWQTPCPGGFWGSHPGQTPETTPVERVELPPDVTGLSTRAGLTIPGGLLVAAERSPGTRVGTLLLLTGDTVRWRVDIPAGDPLAAEEGGPDVAGYGQGRVFAQWTARDGGDTPDRLACFDAATGRRRWDTTLEGDTGDVGAVVADTHHVYVVRWTWLQVLDLETGEPVRTIGIW